MKNKKEFCVLLILIIFFSIAIAPKEFQNDTFFIIAGGKNILENGISEIDNLTWHENLKFTNDRWLFDIIIAKIYEIWNFFGIYIFVIIQSIFIGCTFYYFLIKRNINMLFSFIMTIVIMYLGRGILAARSQIISIWLFIIELYAIEKILETNKLRYWITLIFTPIILANIHASIFPMYFILYLPYLAEMVLSKVSFIQKNGEKVYITERKFTKSLIIVMIIAIFTGLCTPIGDAPYTSMFKAISGISLELIEELKPIIFIKDIEFAIINIIFISILAFTKTKISMSELFLFVGLDLMSFSTYRSRFYLFFIGSIVCINLINKFLIENGIYNKFYNDKFKKIIYAVTFVIFTICCTNAFTHNIIINYFDVTQYPENACSYILSNIDTENMKLFNELNYGSYIEYRGIKSFIDSRTGMFCEEFNKDVNILNDYFDMTKGLVHYNEIFEKYEITHVLLKDKSLVEVYIKNDENWKIIYYDSSFVLYEKVNL